nr:MAG TPA: hypothetical protein [Caudoviricetes sp.]
MKSHPFCEIKTGIKTAHTIRCMLLGTGIRLL